MSNFNLLHQELVYNIEQRTYTLQHYTQYANSKLFYKEWVDNKGDIIDCGLWDDEGNEIREYTLLESAQEFIHQLNKTT